jgi:hypothetical protein
MYGELTSCRGKSQEAGLRDHAGRLCVCARSDGSLSSLYLGIEAMDSRIVLADCSWSVVEWCIEDESG